MVMIANLQIIPDFPQCRVDNKGNIYRICRNGQLKKLVQHADKDGYMIIRVRCNGHRRSLKVHRLICCAFHGPCAIGMVSRHLDGNRSNNLPNNLRWGTSQDNSDDKKIHGTMCTKEKHGRARFTQTDIDSIRSRYANGETQQSIANDFATTQNRISEIVTRKTWK